jgi:hypothetical protein
MVSPIYSSLVTRYSSCWLWWMEGNVNWCKTWIWEDSQLANIQIISSDSITRELWVVAVWLAFAWLQEDAMSTLSNSLVMVTIRMCLWWRKDEVTWPEGTVVDVSSSFGWVTSYLVSPSTALCSIRFDWWSIVSSQWTRDNTVHG